MAFRIGIFQLILGIACIIGAVPILVLHFTNLHSNDVNMKFRKSIPTDHEGNQDFFGKREKDFDISINRKDVYSNNFQVCTLCLYVCLNTN